MKEPWRTKMEAHEQAEEQWDATAAAAVKNDRLASEYWKDGYRKGFKAAAQPRDQRIKELEAELLAARAGESDLLASTRRRARSGVVHEMADLGVDYLCGRTAQEPFNWTDDLVTCRKCLVAIVLAEQEAAAGKNVDD